MLARRHLLAGLTLAPTPLFAQPAGRALTLVVPFAPGGSTDVGTRLIAPRLAHHLGRSVVVENRPGAGGNIGTEIVSRTEPDGYTLLATSVGPIAINPTLYSKLKVNPLTELTPVAPLADVPNVLVVNPNLPVKNVKDLIAYAKAHPNTLNFSSTGVGTAAHLSGVLFNERAGVKTTHVPYKGADALNDLLAGRVQFMFATLPSVISHIRSGNLRALAVAADKRNETLPELPTMAEAGLPGVVTGAWFGLFAPKGTPKDVVARLNKAVVDALAKKEIKSKLAQQGADAMRLSPEGFGKFVMSENQRWKPVVVSSGARID